VTLPPLALTVLSLLHERSAHPYELQQTIHDRSLDRFVKVNAGSLYHTVERLHRRGLIEPVRTARSGRRPERTVYAITDDGRDEFRDTLRGALRHLAPEYPVFGTAIEMLRVLDPSDAAALLGYRAVALESVIAGFEQAAISLAKNGHNRIDLIETEYALALRRAELAWVTTVVDDINAGTLTWSTAPEDRATDRRDDRATDRSDDRAAPDAEDDA
jgi:DNA-binding PadR family transcriptional regulator